MSNNEALAISRVTRSKAAAKASYNKMSKYYDLIAGRAERKYRSAGLQKLSAKAGEVVLEIGFGTGHGILALSRSVGSLGKVYGIDISEEMCAITQKRVNKAGLSEIVRLQCGDAAKLPYEAYYFDAIFISFTLELFDTPEIPIVLSECNRVLRTGGRIVVVALSKVGGTSIMMNLYEWAHKRFQNYVDCRPIYVQRSLEDAGFYIADTAKMSMWGLPIEIVVAKKVQIL